MDRLGRNTPSDNGRDTPKDVSDVPLRADTPGPMPNFIYTRDKLLDLEQSEASKIKPTCLSEEHFTLEGLWDPERWFRSFDSSRNNSPLTIDRDKRREIDRDYMSKRRPSDPKERLKEEKDGIVLSPQRRSFGTGCHVTQSLSRQISCPSDFKDGSERDRDRGTRRIGSGRIQLDRDREIPRERGERDIRAIRDRFDRDDRDRDRRFDRERDRGFGRRDYDDRRDFRHYNNSGGMRQRRDSYRNHGDDEEPEWFTSGPTSQTDTIELHGFEKNEEKKTKKKQEEVVQEEVTVKKPKEVNHVTVEVIEADESNEENKDITVDVPGVAGVVDRNGSLETNEASSPEESNHSDSLRNSSPPTSIFDFNEFFKIDNLPGLSEGASPSADIPVLQSRFSQWFANKPRSGSRNNSRENSRRSSLNDDFGYLNDLLGGSRSPIIPSPPPPSANSMLDHSVFSTNSTFADKPQHHSIDFTGLNKSITPMLSAIFQNHYEKRTNSPTSKMNFSTQDAEAQLKALLFGRKDSTPSSSGTASPSIHSPLNVLGRVKTVAELEADMKPGPTLPSRCFTPPQQPVPPPPPPSTPQQLQMFSQKHQLPPQQMQQPLQPQPMPPQMMPPTQPQQKSSQDEGDLTAFNKLLSLMKAGAAAAVESPKLVGRQDNRPAPPSSETYFNEIFNMVKAGAAVESPKLVGRQDNRPVSPPGPPPSQAMLPQMPNSQAAAAAAQNEFLQALQRNKEQQLQIRQQTMNQMQMRMQHPGKTLTPQQLQAPPNQIAPTQPSQPLGTQRLPGPQGASDPIISFIKQNPTIITKPASPTPPPQSQPQSQPAPTTMMGVLQSTSTPRAPSPSAQLMQQNLLPQAPSSPRVPSPIMFGQQPPMHLSAPSPIHPTQLAHTSPMTVPVATTLTSTATIRPPVIPRVPSPQELIARTQAIMQTALLKKQLEDQKERFIRKQQERAKSPNPVVQTPASIKCANQPISSTPVTSSTSQTQNKTSVTAAFTPTSVIRKMHSDKATEKEKQRQDGVEEQSPAPKAPVKQLVLPDGTINMGDKEQKTEPGQDMVNHSINSTTANSMQPVTASMSSSFPINTSSLHMSVAPASLSHDSVITSQGTSTSGSSIPHDMQTTLAEQLSQLTNPTLQQKQHSRALVGQGMMQNMASQATNVPTQTPGRAIVKGPVGQTTGTTVTTQTPVVSRPLVGQQITTPQINKEHISTPHSTQVPTPQPHRAIIGVSGVPTSIPGVAMPAPALPQQRQFNLSPNPLTRPITGTPVAAAPGVPFGIPITGRIPVQPAIPTNPLMMQQMMTGISPNAARVNALNQLNALNHVSQLNQLALQAQQPRIVDPRLQGGIRGVYPAVPSISPRSSVGVPTTSLGMPVGTSLGINVATSRALSPQAPMQKLINGPVSPGIPIHSMHSGFLNGNNNIAKQGDPHLAKWFGTDVLKTQLPNMPSIPAQGQRVMTLEEIERCQQAVTN